MDERFEQFWTGFLEGELDAAGIAELNQLLDAGPPLRAKAADLYEEHRLLGLALGPADRDAFVRATLERLRGDRERFVAGVAGRLPSQAAWRFLPRVWVRYAVVAAATLLLTLGGQWLLRRPQPESSPEVRYVPAEYVATLVRTHQAEWAPATAPMDGQRLLPGKLRLQKGMALVRFDSGALVVLTGPAELGIESPGGATLHSGRATVRAAEEAAGFTLHTPARDVIDLGTEFAVVVDGSGSTEVHVLEGEVESTRAAGPEFGQVLQGGEAVRFTASGAETGERVPLQGPRFRELVDQMGPNADRDGLLAYEGFSYRSGRQAPREADGGIGWIGPWRVRQGTEVRGNPDAATELFVSAESLRGPRPLPAGAGGALEMQAGASYYLRQLAKPIDLGRDAVYYGSFLLREAPREPTTLAAKPAPVCRFTFRSSADYWSHAVGVGLPPNLRPQLYAPRAGSPSAAKRLPKGATCLWVFKIVASKDGPDQVFLKVYRPEDPVDPLEPRTWTVATGGFYSDARFDLLVLTGVGTDKHWFDEIRIGTTWDTVAAPKGTP